ncbi:MAG: PDC sensor domain-containing protein [Vicinamibacteria bacterium]
MDLLSLGLWLAVQSAAGAAKVREIAGARVPLAERIAGDASFQAELAAKNASAETLEQIQRKDKEWVAGGRGDLRRAMTQGACADRLREVVKDDPFVVEAFLIDARGALVCATRETTDYYQGDEPKWAHTFEEGRRVFVDEPALDPSTGAYAIQLSVLVSANGAKAGALTLTLKVPDVAVR